MFRKSIQITLAIIAICLCSSLNIYAQEADSTQRVATSQHPTVPDEAEELFRSLIPKRDSTYLKMGMHKDNFAKRFSLHFNMLEWALTLPNMGIEFDLNSTEKNNRSILLYGKFNGKMRHNYNPQFVFNDLGGRVEFRKYWRTGAVGNAKNHKNEYVRINLKYPNGLLPDTFSIAIKKQKSLLKDYDKKKGQVIEEDTIAKKTTNADTKQKTRVLSYQDSLLIKQYNGDPYRGWLYNHYHKFRRNVTSGRTLRSPRDWRAYYLGAYAGIDKWNICFDKKGKQGIGASLGMSLGWSIPLLTRQFPSEGGLDLELGALIGPRVLKYDAYNYVTESACYEYDAHHSKNTWTISKNPLQEVRISFVYRFRSVRNKVSRSIIDDYQTKWVDPFNDSITSRRMALTIELDSLKQKIEIAKGESAIFKIEQENLSFKDNWDKRRLENARRINPDTVFVGVDDSLYQVLFKPVSENTTKKKGQNKNKKNNSIEKKLSESDIQAAEDKKKETGKSRKSKKKQKDDEQVEITKEDGIISEDENANNSKEETEKQVIPETDKIPELQSENTPSTESEE